MMVKKYARDLYADLLIILIGILIAIIFVQTGVLQGVLSLTSQIQSFTAFVAGIFFTSAFTLAPAAVVLSHISDIPAYQVALLGGLGAMLGDLILFLFIRDRFAQHILRFLAHSRWKHVLNSFHFGFLRYLSPLLGAVIIASPLPDEFGLMLMGMSRMRIAVLLPLTFVMNTIGVYLVISVTQFF